MSLTPTSEEQKEIRAIKDWKRVGLALFTAASCVEAQLEQKFGKRA